MPNTQPSGKQPITFVTKHSHLRLPAWNAVYRGTLEFNFRTVEPTGLILFSGSQSRNDFIAVEIYDAILYLVINLGNKAQRFRFSGVQIDDGKPHYVRIERDGRDLKLTLDNEERQDTIDGTDTSLELGAIFFVGGVDRKERLPWHVWTGDAAGIALGEDRKYFRGCIWDLKMNGQESIDLESYVQEQKITGIESGCRDVPVDCETDPCHAGTCTERVNGFFCDCSQTNFTGKRCELGQSYSVFYVFCIYFVFLLFCFCILYFVFFVFYYSVFFRYLWLAEFCRSFKVVINFVLSIFLNSSLLSAVLID